MADRRVNFANAYETTLAGSISGAATTMQLTSVTGLSAPCYLVIDPGDPSKREFVYVSTLAGSVATLAERHLSGSAAGSGLSHDLGAVVKSAPVGQELRDLHDRIDAIRLDHGSELDGLGDDDHTQYHNASRALTWLQGRSTTDLPEGSNLYYTQARQDSRFTTLHSAVDHGILTDHGALQGLSDDDHPQYATIQTVSFGEAGTLSTKTGTVRWYAPFDLTIQRVTASVGTAPTGATLIVDVNRSGTTIFTTQGNRPTVAISGFFDASGTPDVTAMTKDTHYLTVDVDQVGSTVAGADLTVTVEYVRA